MPEIVTSTSNGGSDVQSPLAADSPTSVEPTPETNAALVHSGAGCWDLVGVGTIVRSDFARSLERRLRIALRELEALTRKEVMPCATKPESAPEPIAPAKEQQLPRTAHTTEVASEGSGNVPSEAAPEWPDLIGSCGEPKHAPMSYETFVLMKKSVEAQCEATYAVLLQRDKAVKERDSAHAEISRRNTECKRFADELLLCQRRNEELEQVLARANPPTARAYDCLHMLEAVGMGSVAAPHGNTLTGMVMEACERLQKAEATCAEMRSVLEPIYKQQCALKVSHPHLVGGEDLDRMKSALAARTEGQ